MKNSFPMTQSRIWQFLTTAQTQYIFKCNS